jgi:hypothetical protein
MGALDSSSLARFIVASLAFGLAGQDGINMGIQRLANDLRLVRPVIGRAEVFQLCVQLVAEVEAEAIVFAARHADARIHGCTPLYTYRLYLIGI